MREDLSGLRALLHVAQRRSFRAAAAELLVTPSAVSQSVRALEERLGVRLLQRTTRNVGLTELGEQFVARLKPALHAIDDAVESLGELRGRPSGLLRVTALRTGYTDVLKPHLARFLVAYPDIRVDISLDESLTNIVAQGFDAGLRLGESLDPEMIAVRVSADQQVVVVGAPSYFRRRAKPAHPRDLHAQDCIQLRKLSWRFRENGNELEIAVAGHIVTNDAAVVVDAAVEGLGLAYVFESMVHEFLAQDRLVCVLEQYCPRIPGYFLYYPTRAHVPPKLKALIEFIRDADDPRAPRAPASGSSRRASRRR